jgi:DNA-binding MarR family transcriptional regulator
MSATSASVASGLDRIGLLLGSLGSRLTAALAEPVDEGLTGTGTVLVISALSERGPLRPRDLRAITQLTSGGTTNQLDRLVGLGLVSRSHHALDGDRRAVLVTLTSERQRVADAIARVVSDHGPEVVAFLADLRDALGGRARGSDAVPLPSTVDRARAHAVMVGLGRLGLAVGATMEVGFDPGIGRDNENVVIVSALAARGPLRPRDLREHVSLTSGGLSKKLARLEAAGLIRQQRGVVAADRRATVLTITPQGRRRLRIAVDALADRHAAILAIVREVETALLA